MRKFRNLLVHGTWLIQPPYCAVFQYKPGHDPTHGVISVADASTTAKFTLPKLQRVLNDVEALREQVGALITEFVKERIAELDRQHKRSGPVEPFE